MFRVTRLLFLLVLLTPAWQAARPPAGPGRYGRRTHRLLQFRTPPGPDEIRAVRRAGADVVAFIPDRTLVVAAGPDFRAESLDLSGSGFLAASDKVSPRAAAASAWVVVFHPDVRPDDARKLLSAEGFQAIDHPDLLPSHYLATGGNPSALASSDEVAYIFPASAELLTGAHVTPCGGASIGEIEIGEYVRSGPGWPVTGPGGLELGYHFGTLTDKLPQTSIQSEILRALTEWSKYIDLRWVESGDASAPRTLSILFARGGHGDSYPFDGRGRTLAHTFYPAPPNPEPIAGDMHLDADENWGIGGGTDLYTVVLHEAGHALGLAHSDNPSSLMYPYYRPGAAITDDDIAGIRSLYGAHQTRPAPDPSFPPLVVTVQPGPSSTTDATVRLSGVVVNARGSVEIEWHSDRGASGTAEGSRWSIAAAPLSLGANTFTVTARDAAGSTASASVVITRTSTPTQSRDSAAPVLRITTPATTITQTSSATYTVRGTASDNVGIESVTWSSSSGGSGQAAGLNSWSASVPLIVGNNVVTVRAADAAGNASTRSITVVRR